MADEIVTTKEMTYLATQVHLRAYVPTVLVQVKLDEYWESVKDRLDPSLIKKATRGYRLSRERVVEAAGGEQEFYRGPLLELLSDQFAELYKEPFSYLQYASHRDVEKGQHILDGVAYLEPQVQLNLQGTEEKVFVPELNIDLIDKQVERRIESIRDQNIVLAPKEGMAELGDAVVLNSNAVVDGKPWEPACFTAKKIMLKPQGIRIPAVLDAILGHGSDVILPIKAVLDETYGPELVGKELTGTIRIVQVYTVETPEINDDLAIDAGYKTLEQMRTAIEKETENQMISMREQQLFNLFLGNVLDHAKVDPLPEPWILSKASECYAEQRARYKTEQAFLEANGCKNKDDLIINYGSQIRMQTIHNLVLRKYVFELQLCKPARLNMMAQTIPTARAKILQRLEHSNKNAEENKDAPDIHDRVSEVQSQI